MNRKFLGVIFAAALMISMPTQANVKPIASATPTGVSNSKLHECENRAGFVYFILDGKDNGLSQNEVLSGVYARMVEAGLPINKELRELVIDIYASPYEKNSMRKATLDAC